MTPPSPAFQLEFIERIQRLLDSGSFVATYKYALLIALCNVAAEQGFDDEREQHVELRDLGVQFLRLYWTHSRPYPALGEQLHQNTDKQRPAAIIGTVDQARQSVPRPDRMNALNSVPEMYLKQASELVRDMPLKRLQTIGEERKGQPDHPDNFLYAPKVIRGNITLRSGVSACLRKFRTLIVAMAEARWAARVRILNPDLGAGSDLEAFLFGVDRVSLHHLVPELLDVQGGRCFYTGRSLKSDKLHVDHFIPWSHYQLNSPFNLVVTSDSTNSLKSDHLPAVKHLGPWLRRNQAHSQQLLALGASQDDQTRVLRVARFAYGQAQRLNTFGWLQGRDLVPITGWEQALPA